jgi:hypothetical protein
MRCNDRIVRRLDMHVGDREHAAGIAPRISSEINGIQRALIETVCSRHHHARSNERSGATDLPSAHQRDHCGIAAIGNPADDPLAECVGRTLTLACGATAPSEDCRRECYASAHND